MNIRGFLPSSFNEWEGRVSAVVFTGGCNWRCSYCHGARLVNDFASLPEIPADKVFSTLSSRRGWVDGVVITGGEPTLQPDLIDFIRELHRRGLPVKLSTNGTNPQAVEQLLEMGLLTCLGFDYKTVIDERLLSLTALPNGENSAAGEQTLANVRRSFALARAAAEEKAAEIEFHTTLCPAFVDAKTIDEMGAALQLPRALWVLQQYENDVEMIDAARAGTDRFSLEELEKIEQTAKNRHPRVLLRRGK